MEPDLSYGFKKSWSPPASPSTDHYLGNSRPTTPRSDRTRRLKTVIRSSTPSPRRSPKIHTARSPYNSSSDDEAKFNPSVEAEKTAQLNVIDVTHAAVTVPAATTPEGNENVRWEDCVAVASEVELSPREHPVEWLRHELEVAKKKDMPMHWPTLKERSRSRSRSRVEQTLPAMQDKI